jgi:hypothetical protein
MSFRTNSETVLMHGPGSGQGATLTRIHLRYDSTDDAYYLTADTPLPVERAGFVDQGDGTFLLSRNERGAPAAGLVRRGTASILLRT